jgi:hypothetical protein
MMALDRTIQLKIMLALTPWPNDAVGKTNNLTAEARKRGEMRALAIEYWPPNGKSPVNCFPYDPSAPLRLRGTFKLYNCMVTALEKGKSFPVLEKFTDRQLYPAGAKRVPSPGGEGEPPSQRIVTA